MALGDNKPLDPEVVEMWKHVEKLLGELTSFWEHNTPLRYEGDATHDALHNGSVLFYKNPHYVTKGCRIKSILIDSIPVIIAMVDRLNLSLAHADEFLEASAKGGVVKSMSGGVVHDEGSAYEWWKNRTVIELKILASYINNMISKIEFVIPKEE